MQINNISKCIYFETEIKVVMLYAYAEAHSVSCI